MKCAGTSLATDWHSCFSDPPASSCSLTSGNSSFILSRKGVSAVQIQSNIVYINYNFSQTCTVSTDTGSVVF
jgi:hypothetical protein